MRTLRARLILSHTLPLLVIILFLSIALDYMLETRIMLPGFGDELANEAKLVAEMATTQPDLWDNPSSAQAYLNRLKPILEPFVSFLDVHGELLASTDPNAGQIGTMMESGDQFAEVLAGSISIQTNYSRHLEADVVDVMVPVFGPDEQVVGAVRMTYHLENVYAQFLTLRYVIIGVLAVGLFIGVVMALILALNLSSALQQVTKAVRQLARGREYTPPIEQGPEEIRILLRTFNTLVTRLRDFEKNRRKLLANLIHELGRPLGALLLAVQALQGGAGEDESLHRNIMIGMEEELGILQRLLNDLTGLYDQVTGVLELKTQPIALTEWLRIVLQTHRESASAKGLHWQVTIPDDLPVIDVDPDRLAQALGNLVDNAIKFTPSGGEVSVDVSVQDNGVDINVQDTGPGIPMDEQANVFTRFYRGHSENRFPQGMGLGLSIARDLVMAHQGRLEFTSVPGEGSCFTIWLPVKVVENKIF